MTNFRPTDAAKDRNLLTGPSAPVDANHPLARQVPNFDIELVYID